MPKALERGTVASSRGSTLDIKAKIKLLKQDLPEQAIKHAHSYVLNMIDASAKLGFPLVTEVKLQLLLTALIEQQSRNELFSI